MLECVINISEGRNLGLIDQLGDCVADALLDIHTDPDHNRSVFTLVGTDAPRTLTRAAVELLSLNNHDGVHPRLGVVDVVPFVPLADSTMNDAVNARDEFAVWASTELKMPVFLYGEERSLPDIRRHAWTELMPDVGPHTPHHTAGALCVGARKPLVAWNIWLRDVDIDRTRDIARRVRTPQMRTLGLRVGDYTQVSFNLIEPNTFGPDSAYDAVAQCAAIERCELVGLIPRDALVAISSDRWEALDLDETKTIEWRLENRR
ncbi:MAG: hypothetical protein RIR69_1150 [Actinomycetota bacterium]